MIQSFSLSIFYSRCLDLFREINGLGYKESVNLQNLNRMILLSYVV